MSSFQNIRNRNTQTEDALYWTVDGCIVRKCIRDVCVAPCLDVWCGALVRYSSLSQFLPICFLFERVMSLLNKELERLMNLDPLPSNWFPVDQVMVWCNDRVGTTLLTLPKTHIVLFSARELQE